MASFDFDKLINRKQSSSVKWDLLKELYGESDLLPMWVADMDFEPPTAVTEAIKERVEHGIFGYTYTPKTTNQTIKNWLYNRHSWDIRQSSIVYHSGVVPAIATCIQAFTKPGDSIIVHAPVYRPFFDLIEKNKRIPVFSPLLLENNQFYIDFDDFEQKLQQGAKLFILCNPHNPGGRVWTKEELTKIADLCRQYDCLILSDEIHSDLVYKPNRHIPIVSLHEDYEDFIITCIAPTKTFNLAGLQASAIIIPNKELRNTFKNAQAQQGMGMINIFGIVGMEAAYQHGEQWLEALLDYIAENIQLVKEYIGEHLPQISVMEPEGTYLIWLDCRKLGLSDKEIQERLVKKGKLALEPGSKFGQGGEGFVRINLACPHETVMDGLQRLKRAFTD